MIYLIYLKQLFRKNYKINFGTSFVSITKLLKEDTDAMSQLYQNEQKLDIASLKKRGCTNFIHKITAH